MGLVLLNAAAQSAPNNYYMSNYSYLFKYIVIGDSSVGKSCLMLQFLEGKFNPDHDATIGVEFGSKIIRSRQKDIKLQIWDTAGQEAYKSITRSYYRGSIGIILAYDITRRKSFENVVKWIEDTKKYANEKISLILVGNKEDLSEKRVVSMEEGRELAEQNNVLFLETSAKTPYNVNELFQNLTDRLVDRIESKELDDKDEMCGIKKGLIERQRLLDSQRTVKRGWCW